MDTELDDWMRANMRRIYNECSGPGPELRYVPFEINSVVESDESEGGIVRDLVIKPVLNGFVVTAGCQTLAFEGRDSLKKAFSEYVDDPLGFEQSFVKQAVNQRVTYPGGDGPLAGTLQQAVGHRMIGEEVNIRALDPTPVDRARINREAERQQLVEARQQINRRLGMMNNEDRPAGTMAQEAGQSIPSATGPGPASVSSRY